RDRPVNFAIPSATIRVSTRFNEHRSGGRVFAALHRRMALISLVTFLVLGVIVMIIAKALLPGRDPGIGITLLLGTAAQLVAWIVGRFLGSNRFGQPWSFFLSIGVACLLLYAYRESGLDDVQ